MTVAKSTKRKPRKPYPSYPLWPYPNGQWAIKLGGKIRFCGVWAEPENALSKYKQNRVAWLTGTILKEQSGWTVKRVIDQFLDRLETKADAGDRSRRHFEDCKRTGLVIAATWDKTRLVSDLNGSDFFELRQRFAKKKDGKAASPATLLGHIRRTVSIFQFAVKEGLVDRVVYGADFRGLSEKQKTTLEAKAGDKLLDAATVRKLLDKANYRLKAMILLGVNCGLGNTDIATLAFNDLDLAGGWYEAAREKTAVRRCAKLWPETVQALEIVIQKRFDPENKQDRDLVFVTRYKRSYSDQSAVTNEFAKLAKAAKVKLPKGTGFYSLRHTCRTIADASADESAKRWIVGHKRSKIEDRYIHAPPKERIAAVCESVRTWLFMEGGAK